MDSRGAELEQLLSESVRAATERERSAFGAAARGSGDRIVLFGAGVLGQRTLSALRERGLEPLAFVDNNRELWGSQVMGCTVLPPPEAAGRYGRTACFVLCAWPNNRQRNERVLRKQLADLGCRTVVHFGCLFWAYPELLPHYALDLPHQVLEQRELVRRSYRLMSDDASRREYVAQLRWRLRLDFDALPDPETSEQYFPRGLFRWCKEEVFVDCGAFDGDTLKVLFRRRAGHVARAIAFEPDPANMRRLRAWIRTLPGDLARRVELRPVAVAERTKTVQFRADGTSGSAIGSGAQRVHCVALDDELRAVRSTYIKMDVEGAEPGALEGARRLLRRDRPLLAISAYHRQDHLWTLPQVVAQSVDDYAFFLRSYTPEGWELVLYAVPRERLAAAHRQQPKPRAAKPRAG